jgi:hypothetical protein
VETVIEFVDPPTKYRREKTYDWDNIYQSLRDNPGQWALLVEQGKMSTYNAIAQSNISNFKPDMGIETRLANSNYKTKPRRADIYVRYNPDLHEGLTVKEREALWRTARKIEKEKQVKVSKLESGA